MGNMGFLGGENEIICDIMLLFIRNIITVFFEFLKVLCL